MFVGMWNSAAIMESSMEFPQKLQIKVSYDPEIPLFGNYQENQDLEEILASIATLFTVAKMWKQIFMDRWMDEEKILYTMEWTIWSKEYRKFCHIWQHE